ncbi:MAG: FtsW/RodA/SpoVE family cell cycle protein [Bacillota bacterium]|nr:FtsW/RodA/SpoVE family cell cycle protein [Bacillota bacterium]
MERLGLEARRRDVLFQALDYWLLVPVLAIGVIGLYVLNFVLENQFARSYPRNILVQLLAFGLGLIVLVVLTLFEAQLLRPFGWGLYLLALGLQALLPVFGSANIAAATGSNAWLVLPGIGTFQPSELAKVALCIVIGHLLADIRTGRLALLPGILLFGLIVAPHLGLIIVYQRDAGTGLVILFMLAVMVFVQGIRLRWILLAFSLGIISLPLIWTKLLRPYQQGRILAFLFPHYDAASTYNVDQAKLAIASGGLTGNKTGPWVHVPVQESDFIFSAVGEYMGLIGTGLLIVLAFFFLLRCVVVSARMETPAARYMASGVTAIFAIHYIENIGMNIGLLPVTGIPLPFVSQGGSAMVVNFMALGVLMNFSFGYRMERV